MGTPASTCVFWLLLLLSLLGGGGAGKRYWRETRRQRPQFADTENEIEVMVGHNARLPCVVLHLNDRAVTWLRRRDLHILTTGHHTYSADDRFQVVAGSGRTSWPLLVKSAQPRDSGIYECQVNTDPKMSRPITLTVRTEADTRTETRKPEDSSTVPLSVTKSKVFVANKTAVTRDGHLRVEIEGPSEVNIEERSKLSLNCVVTSTLGAAAVVYWFHDSTLLNYGPKGVKLKIDQERGITNAQLVVENVGMENDGMYSCVPPGSHPASVRVHVHTGKQEAAIQQSGFNDTTSCSQLHYPLPYILPSILSISILPSLPENLPSSIPFFLLFFFFDSFLPSFSLIAVPDSLTFFIPFFMPSILLVFLLFSLLTSSSFLFLPPILVLPFFLHFLLPSLSGFFLFPSFIYTPDFFLTPTFLCFSFLCLAFSHFHGFLGMQFSPLLQIFHSLHLYTFNLFYFVISALLSQLKFLVFNTINIFSVFPLYFSRLYKKINAIFFCCSFFQNHFNSVFFSSFYIIFNALFLCCSSVRFCYSILLKIFNAIFLYFSIFYKFFNVLFCCSSKSLKIFNALFCCCSIFHKISNALFVCCSIFNKFNVLFFCSSKSLKMFNALFFYCSSVLCFYCSFSPQNFSFLPCCSFFPKMFKALFFCCSFFFITVTTHASSFIYPYHKSTLLRGRNRQGEG